jgi:hypothetical protein
MAPDAVLVYADGVAIDPKTLMLERPSAGVQEALLKHATLVEANATALDCPISQTGSLNTAEIYRDGRQTTLGYYLPVYQLGLVQADTPPLSRYEVRLEFTSSPGESFVGRLRVQLKGEKRAEVVEQGPRAQTIGFTGLPNGTPSTPPLILNGDEFATQGLLLATAPESSYCAEATRVAIRPAGTYGIPFPFLTTATPNDVGRCNTVLLAASFAQPVARVSLTFAGASVPYVLTAYNAQGAILGRVTTQGELGKTLDIAFVAQGGVVGQPTRQPPRGAPIDTEFVALGDIISRITFGHTSAVTAIKEISYERSAKHSCVIRFGVLDGVAVTKARSLQGDEFLAAGIRLAGVPQGTYCSTATMTAVVPANTYRNARPVLTSAAPGNATMCNTVPISITFVRPVRSVTLKFYGAAVTYSLRAMNASGQPIAKVDRQVTTYGEEYDIALAATRAPIAQVQFGHFGDAKALTAVSEIAYEEDSASTAPEITEIRPLPHSIAVSLCYLLSENPGDPTAMASWKTLAFDEVSHRDHQDIEAVAHLRTLPELDAIHRAMTDARARCQIVIKCEADLAVKNLNQVFVNRNAVATTALSANAAVLVTLPVAAPHLARAVDGGKASFTVASAPVQPPVTIAEVAPLRPPVTTAEVAPVQSPVPITEVAPLPAAQQVAHAEFANLQWVLGATAVSSIPAKYFADSTGEPAYTKLRKVYEQALPFNFDPAVHAYIYPARQPGSEAALVRYAVSSDLVIFQDSAERHVFYYLPDEFRLTRDDVPSPTFKPMLQIAFRAVTTTAQDTTETSDVATGYRVQFTFRAVPYLLPLREAEALRYIEEHNLVPGKMPVSLLPLTPSSAVLTLLLPKEGGGMQQEVRTGALVVFDKFIVDSLDLSDNAFSEIFHSMGGGGETLNGAVKYTLAGSSEEEQIPLSGRLDKMVGPMFEVQLIGPTDASGSEYRIKVTNAIESSIELREAAVYLLEDPQVPTWVLASIVFGGSPVIIAPGESRELTVRPTRALAQAFAARLNPLQVAVDIDFERLWLSVLETPGWDDIIQKVTVTINSTYFTGPTALEKVVVSFNAEEKQITLNREVLRHDIELVRPFLAYLHRLPSADDYFFRVESWRKPDPASEPVKIAETAWTKSTGRELPITPPLG